MALATLYYHNEKADGDTNLVGRMVFLAEAATRLGLEVLVDENEYEVHLIVNTEEEVEAVALARIAQEANTPFTQIVVENRSFDRLEQEIGGITEVTEEVW